MPIKKRLNNVVLFNRQGIYFRDESETSPDIFRVTFFPTRLTAGKNVIKIQGNSNTLAPGAFIEIEVTDANGDPIYTEMLNYLEDDGSRAISIFIYPNTSEGDARVTLGTEIRQLNGQPVPIQSQGKINAIWSKLVPVTPTVNNNSEIIFTTEPTVTIEETVGVQLDREFEGGSQTASYSTGKVQYYEYNNDSKILISNGKFVGDMKGGTITVANPVNPRPTPNFTLPNPPAYTSTIKKVLNDQIISLDTPFTFLTNQSLAVQRYTEFDNSDFEINFNVSPEYIATQNSQSFALMQVKNLDPAAGAVSRLKLYANNNGTVGDYELINDIDLTPTEIFVDATGSITPDVSVGFFTSQSIIDNYWESQKWNGIVLETPNPQLTWQTSSLNNAINIEKTTESTSAADIQILKIQDNYAGTFIKDSQYKIQFDAIASRLDPASNPKISIYMSGSAFSFDDDLLNKSLGRNIGKKIGEVVTTSDEKRYDDKSFVFDADADGKAVLIIVIEKGQWQFSEIQTTSDALFGFSENYTRLRTLVPVAHKSGNQVSFKLEYYNISGAKSKTVTFINDENFQGGNRYIDGDFSMLTGSLTVANNLRTGVEIVGLANTGYIRSLGYEGFNQATGSSPGGFLMFSGSALPQQTETSYEGVGLELVSNANNFFKYRTNPSILDIHTETFFLGNPSQQFISGAAGQLEISSSGYHFTPEGHITASGGFLFGDKQADQFIQFIDGQLVVKGELSVDEIFTPALINGSPSNVTNASSSITSQGFAKFVSASIGGWDISTNSIEGGNLLMKPEGILQTRDFASGLKGWKISSEENGTAEFENVRIRGTLRTTTFEKESVNAVGGQVWVTNSTTITGSDVIATDTTMSVKNASGFSVGEILLAKKVDNTGFQTEYILLESASIDGDGSNEDETGGRIYVQRGYGNGGSAQNSFVGDLASAAQGYTDGQVIVSTGKLGTGYIKLNANPNDQSTPLIDIVERTGSGLYDVELKARLGDLSGLANSDYVFGNSNPGFGLATDNVFLQGGIIANTGSIGGIEMQNSKLFTGTGTFNNSNTGFFLGADSKFSLGDKLSWNGTTLSVSGNIQVTNPGDFASPSSSVSLNYNFAGNGSQTLDTGIWQTRNLGTNTPSNIGIRFSRSGTSSWDGGIRTKKVFPRSQAPVLIFDFEQADITTSAGNMMIGWWHGDLTDYNDPSARLAYGLYIVGATIRARRDGGSETVLLTDNAVGDFYRVKIRLKAGGGAMLELFRNGDFITPVATRDDGTAGTDTNLAFGALQRGPTGDSMIILKQLAVGTQPATTEISGNGIKTGLIESTNLSTTTGTVLDLNNASASFGGTGAYESNNGILIDGTNAKFAVGNKNSQFMRFNHSAGALEISGSNFSLNAAGSITGSQMRLREFLTTDLICYNIVTIAGSTGKAQYYQDYVHDSRNYSALVLDGSQGGEIATQVRINIAPNYPLGKIITPAAAGSFGDGIQFELAINNFYIAKGAKTGVKNCFLSDSDDWHHTLFQTRTIGGTKYGTAASSDGDIGNGQGLWELNSGARIQFLKSKNDYRPVGITSFDWGSTTNGQINFHRGLRTAAGPIGINIGTSAKINQYAILQVNSNNKGILPPRASGTQISSISPGSSAAGLFMYNTTDDEFNFWNGSAWDTIGTGGTSGTGDITSVTAGSGLSGGGTSGAVSLAVDSTVLRTTGGTMTGNLAMSNKNISGVNNITFADAGVNEGLDFNSNIKIYESPDSLTNAAGNLQIVYGGTRRFTVNNTGAEVVGNLTFNDSNTKLAETSTGDALRLTTPSGYVEIGPQNTGFAHFYTDRAKYYFNKRVVADEGIFSAHNEDLQLRRSQSTSNNSIIIKTTQQEFHSGTGEQMRLKSNGELHVTDDVIGFSSTPSDSRLKDNIIQLGGSLDKIKSLRGVSYTWKTGNKKGTTDIGLIAQEVEKVIPEVVSKKKLPLIDHDNPDVDYKTVNYEKIIPVLIEAIKEQQDQIDELKQQIRKGQDYGNY